MQSRSGSEVGIAEAEMVIDGVVTRWRVTDDKLILGTGLKQCKGRPTSADFCTLAEKLQSGQRNGAQPTNIGRTAVHVQARYRWLADRWKKSRKQ